MGDTVYKPLSSSEEEEEVMKEEEVSEDFFNEYFPPSLRRRFVRPGFGRDFSPKHALISFFTHLIPSFLQRQPSTKSTNPRAGRGNIDSLDGLRGLACLCVVNQHFTQPFTHRLFLAGWGQSDDDYWLAEAPLVKVMWSGSAQVITFFVLSGYVLSVKPIQQMHSGQSAKMHQILASSIFRRSVRLWLPVCFVGIVVVCLAQLGAYNGGLRAYNLGLIASQESIPPALPSLWEHLVKLYKTICMMIDFFNWSWNAGSIAPWFNEHLWSIVIEWRASMMLFLVHTGTSRLRSWIRMSIACFLVVYCGNRAQVTILPFWTGMFLAELDLHYQRWQATGDHITLPMFLGGDQTSLQRIIERISVHLRPNAVFFRAMHIVFFILGLWFCSCPSRGSDPTPGSGIWTTTSAVPSWFVTDNPASWAWNMGATFLVISAVHSPDLKPIYCNRFARYVGKLSFAIYICHGVIIRTAVYGSLPRLFEMTIPIGARTTQMGFFIQWFLGACILWPILFWVADLVHRFVDTPSTRFARWLETVCNKSEET